MIIGNTSLDFKLNGNLVFFDETYDEPLINIDFIDDFRRLSDEEKINLLCEIFQKENFINGKLAPLSKEQKKVLDYYQNSLKKMDAPLLILRRKVNYNLLIPQYIIM